MERGKFKKRSTQKEGKESKKKGKEKKGARDWATGWRGGCMKKGGGRKGENKRRP